MRGVRGGVGVGGGPGDGRPPSELRADWPPSFLLPRSVAALRRAGDDAYLGVIYPADDFVVYGCAGRGGGKGGTGWWRATARRLDPNHRPSPRLSSYVTATRVKLMLAAADPQPREEALRAAFASLRAAYAAAARSPWFTPAAPLESRAFQAAVRDAVAGL